MVHRVSFEDCPVVILGVPQVRKRQLYSKSRRNSDSNSDSRSDSNSKSAEVNVAVEVAVVIAICK